MLVAGIQFDIAWEDPETNLRRAQTFVGSAAASGAKLVVLPEMFATGFSMRSDAMAKHADSTLDTLKSLARTHAVWLLAGLVVPGPDRPENIAAIFDPDGSEILRYSKIHPFSLAGEHENYHAGSTLPTTEIEGIRVTPLICYDLRFPEPFRAAADRTDLFVVIANWPVKRSLAWRVLLAARAIDCLAFVLGVNRVGRAEDGLEHRGDSALVDPLGQVISTQSFHEGVVTGHVDSGAVRMIRNELGFLDDRRPQVYRKLEEE